MDRVGERVRAASAQGNPSKGIDNPTSTTPAPWLATTLVHLVKNCKETPTKILMPVNPELTPEAVAAFMAAAKANAAGLFDAQSGARHKPLDICFCPVNEDRGGGGDGATRSKVIVMFLGSERSVDQKTANQERAFAAWILVSVLCLALGGYAAFDFGPQHHAVVVLALVMFVVAYRFAYTKWQLHR
ncbi:hypothetical protein B0T26DRAFT_756933 [Lasiosphaeria miniovina]|uniref:Uncharacterized protein n=1 Tax=Lasiosphaeria miniovina TaxID=1954250 RepID=A0AA40DH66_9PEZI|nr:uncharacterized protein B0T26DRAFT_756933 [Lasiosphaeria miniovina]KAK0703369.1 hypothetical protein B0T26DRAFT_756933 [Lasiosphaeria miniovina]